MIVDQTSLITITAIVSVTLVGVIALTRNTDIKLDLNLGKNQSLTIEGKRLPLKTNDCLPSGESSQPLNCNNP
jgi:hypothetical protein